MSVCSRCHREHLTAKGGPACAGHRSKNHATDPGGPCANPPTRGLDVCRYHGGGSAKAKAAGERRQAEAKIAALATTLGEPVEGLDPAEVVAERIAARTGHVRWLLARVQALEPDALIWGRTKETETDVVVGTGPGAHLDKSAGTVNEAKPHVWYAMYVEAARDLERLCIDAIRAGLEERRVRIAEQQADAMVRVLDGVLAELGHDPNEPETARVVARHLRAVGD